MQTSHTSQPHNQPTVAAFDTPHTRQQYSSDFKSEKALTRADIIELFRQEFRIANNQQTNGQQYRDRRTFDGLSVCSYCKKKGSRGLCVSTPDSPTRMALEITLTPLAEGQGVILTAHPPGPTTTTLNY